MQIMILMLNMLHFILLGESLLHILIICDTLIHTRIARLLLKVFPRAAWDMIEGKILT